MTALQELTKWWNEDFPEWKKSSEGFEIIEKAIELMEKEKQQIAHAYEFGCIEEMKETFKTGKEFYESVY